MLIGAHVSPSGGPAQAVARGVERGARSIQIFNQNPRQWKPREYSSEEVDAFHAAMQDSGVDALLIHAVYLLNPASEEREFREKTLASLVSSLRAGAALGAEAVVLHPGSALKNGGEVDAAIDRAGEVIAEALKESEKCPLHLEDTAGAGGTLGRSFEELARLIEVAGGGKRLGVCLDSCHLLASGYDVRSAESLSEVLDEFDRIVGLKRLGSLHVNDSVTPLGSNRDRHANLGDGEIGREGIAAFLSEPRFEGMPCVLEGPGHTGKAVDRQDIAWAMQLREEGLAARRGGTGKRERGGSKAGGSTAGGSKRGGSTGGGSKRARAKPARGGGPRRK
jgi:deoxyribonuclease-4